MIDEINCSCQDTQHIGCINTLYLANTVKAGRAKFFFCTISLAVKAFDE